MALKDTAIARKLLSFTFLKRLPKEFGGGSIYVTPRADRRVLRRGWDACANDLVVVARQNLKPGDTVWDVGANLGIFSFLAAGKLGPNGRVYAVEADPEYTNYIHRSAARLTDNYAPVHAISAAVADKPGILDFCVSSRGSARSALKAVSTFQRERTQSVLCTTLDGLLAHWPRPDFVKMDIEGAEHLALSAAQTLLTEIRPTFYIEVAERNSQAVAEHFHAADYQLFQLNIDNERLVDRPGKYTMARPAETLKNSPAA